MSEMSENAQQMTKMAKEMFGYPIPEEVEVGFCRIDGEMIDTTQYTGLGWHMLVRFRGDSGEKIIHTFLGHTLQIAKENLMLAVLNAGSEFVAWNGE